MKETIKDLIRRLREERSLTEAEYARLIEERTPEAAAELREYAVKERNRIYGSEVFFRGLIEISSYCKNDCLYCGLRRSNRALRRYRLSGEEIVSCAEEGFRLGFRTFVLQGGEDAF